MRCIAANRSVLTALDQNTTLADYDRTNCTATTDEIDSMDIIQFADGWYSYPDLNTFDSDFLLTTLTLRVCTCLITHLSFFCIQIFYSIEYKIFQSYITMEY